MWHLAEVVAESICYHTYFILETLFIWLLADCNLMFKETYILKLLTFAIKLQFNFTVFEFTVLEFIALNFVFGMFLKLKRFF